MTVSMVGAARRTRSRLLCVGALLLLSLGASAHGPCGPTRPSLDVTVKLRETAGVERGAELVSFGVPVAREASLIDPARVSVVGYGGVLPAQARVLSRWGAPPGSSSAPIRWLLVSALVDLPAHSETQLRVYDAALARAADLAVIETSAALQIDTGALVARVSKERGTILDSAIIAGVEQLDAEDAGHGVRIQLANADTLTTRSDSVVRSTEILERGPVATTIRQVLEIDDVRLRSEWAESWGTNACFPWLYPCSELQRYRARLSVFATFVRDSTAVRLRVRVENVSVCPVTEDGAKHCALEGSLDAIGFEDLSLRLALADPASVFRSGSLAGSLSEPVTVVQDSSGLERWDFYRTLPPVGPNGYTPGGWLSRGPANVSFRGFETRVGTSVSDSGDRMPGWLTTAGLTSGIAVAIADAWKHFPVALRATPAAIEVGLFPAEFAASHGLRAGERKTHEVAVLFGAPPTETAARRVHAWIERPIRFSFDPLHGVATRAIPGLSRSGVVPEYDLWNRASVDVAVSEAHVPNAWFEPSSLVLARDRNAMWGKKEAGFLPNDNEAETSTDLSKYLQYHGFLLQALRNAGSDDALADVWWEIGIDANRAQADLGYLMTPHAEPDSDWPGIQFAHCFHENVENMTFPRGGGFGCDFAGDVTGMSLLYVLSGYDPALDAIVAHAEHVRRDALRRTRYDREVRSFGSRIEVLVAAWELLGEVRYLEAASHLLDVMEADAGMAYLACPCPGASPDQSLNALFAGWLLRSLGRLADAWAVAGGDGSVEHQRATALLVAHADWYASAVAFTALSPVTGETETVVPYLWHLDGRASNREPVSTSYGLMAVDGLAAAARLGGSASHLATADALFRTILRMPFFFGDWPQFVYSTINDAGKLATFGGELIEKIASEPGEMRP